jgi:hypothetical protein
MYFPYLRGKQFELIALQDCADIIQKNGRIIPIIEPVKIDLNNLTRKISIYIDRNLPIILIVNPTVGELSINNIRIFNEVVPKLNTKGTSHILGFIISEISTLNDIQQFIYQTQGNRICFIHEYELPNPEFLNNIQNIQYQIFIHNRVDQNYQNKFSKNNKVIIEDGFNSQPKNALYPTLENFLDRNLTFQREHYVGFGDYQIIGQEYKEGGGPAHAVVIHITYQKSSGGIGIMHFVSDRTTSNQDTPGKFLEALTKLVNATQSNSAILITAAIHKYHDLYHAGHFPGLGELKKLSIEHHIELIAKII